MQENISIFNKNHQTDFTRLMVTLLTTQFHVSSLLFKYFFLISGCFISGNCIRSFP